MNESTVAQFKADFEQLNKALEYKYKVAINLDKIKYSSTGLTGIVTAIESSNLNELGEPESFEKLEFKRLCKKYGYVPSDYRCKGTVAGRNFVLVGFKPKARKNIYMVENDKGQKFIAPEFKRIV